MNQALASTASMHAPTAPSGNDPLLGRAEFSVIADIMMADARIKLTEGKMTLVHARLSRRLREHGLGTFKEYVRLVQSNADERALLVTSLTTNHTHFFRENHHFEHLRQQVIPSLKEKARVGPVRLWSAGCSSGEEVYTVAMCLLGTDRSSSSWLKNANVKLLATDIAPPVVQATANALYTTQVAEGVPEPYKKLWMRDVVGGFQMADEARELVTAKVLNLFDPWPMRQQYDVIFCRNVMIYFDDDAKAELELRLVQQLAPGGYLYIGHSERLLGAAQNGMKPCGQTVYVKSAGGQL